ncbi:MAG: hypothetical protein M3361_19230, partial [Candidatus Tectomicrobia bacterium]|nr:hypothetical protein [Candidatus Tectomicrobia bacterium]
KKMWCANQIIYQRSLTSEELHGIYRLKFAQNHYPGGLAHRFRANQKPIRDLADGLFRFRAGPQGD